MFPAMEHPLGMQSDVDWSCFAGPQGPGGTVVAFTLGNGPVWRAWGSSAPGDEALDPDSAFYAGSIAKQVTAACVAYLVLDGHITLSTPVREVLPQFPTSMAPIEVEHLLTHTSGLPESNALDASVGFDGRSELSNAERLAALSTVELEAPPGLVHRYSNYGYLLLAEVVQAVASDPFGQFAKRRVLVPAGMHSSGFIDVEHPQPVPGWSKGTAVEIGFTTVGDGGLITTVADLLRWNAWLPKSELPSLMLARRRVMGDGALAHDAWGISIRTHHGRRIESHGGAFDGYLCSAVRFPDLGAVFVGMTNTDELGPTGFNARLRCLVDSVLGDHLDRRQAPWTETHGRPVP